MIPYTIDRREDTGVTNVALGVWLFIASEVMLFGALFSAYALLRTSASMWPAGRDVLNVTIGGANTIVLMAMTTLIWRARSATRAGRGLIVTGTLAAALFLALKAVEYRGELAAGIRPAASTFLAMYFTLTGLHAIHVVLGIAANLWVLAGWTSAAPLTPGRVRSIAIYWAFVDVVWMIMFALLYLS
jgi:heme/copper-type cytochrome/quinol oxidase subunit 3